MDGLFLRGQFVGSEGSRTFTGRDGKPATAGPAVKVLAGSALHTVRYQDDAAFAAAWPTLPEKLAPVEVAVYARGPWNEASGEPARVTFRGRVPEAGVDA